MGRDETSWGLLGATWRHIGRAWGGLGAVLWRSGGGHGPFLGPLGAILGPLGAVPGGLGASWGGPREVLRHLGVDLGPLGRILWVYIAPSQLFIEFGVDLEGQKGDKMEPQTNQSLTQNST